MNNKIFEIVITTISEYNETLDNKIDISNGRESEIFGGNSLVDSLELVNLIVEIEENISEKFNKNITITSEKAMSRITSPFKNVGTITDYIEEILNE
jgi:acyl carrier protein